MLLRLKRDKLYPIRGIKKFMVEISFYMNSEGLGNNAKKSFKRQTVVNNCYLYQISGDYKLWK